MFPILHIGSLAIQVPGLLILVGIWAGTWLIEREAPRQKLSANTLNNLVLVGLVSGILGARLWYALSFLEIYLENPISLASLNPATLAPLEGALTGLLAATAYGNRKGLPLWKTLDALTPAGAALAVFWGLAHLAGGDAFGAPAELPWSVNLWGARRHPTQIYETALAGIVLAAILRTRAAMTTPGSTFLLWMTLAAASRLFLEAFRGDSVIILDTLRSAQLVSLGILLLALAALHLRLRAASG